MTSSSRTYRISASITAAIYLFFSCLYVIGCPNSVAKIRAELTLRGVICKQQSIKGYVVATIRSASQESGNTGKFLSRPRVIQKEDASYRVAPLTISLLFLIVTAARFVKINTAPITALLYRLFSAENYTSLLQVWRV
jgi:hypothetical protein